MLHERIGKMFGVKTFFTFEGNTLEDVVLLTAETLDGEDLIAKHGLDMAVQVLIDLLQEERDEP